MSGVRTRRTSCTKIPVGTDLPPASSSRQHRDGTVNPIEPAGGARQRHPAARAGGGVLHPPKQADLLQVSVAIVGVRGWVTADGPVDLSGAATLAAVLRNVGTPGQQVLVDLSGVTFLAEAGLQVLLEANRRLAARGGELVLAGAGLRIRRLLQLTGYDRLLHLEPAGLRPWSVAAVRTEGRNNDDAD